MKNYVKNIRNNVNNDNKNNKNKLIVRVKITIMLLKRMLKKQY